MSKCIRKNSTAYVQTTQNDIPLKADNKKAPPMAK